MKILINIDNKSDMDVCSNNNISVIGIMMMIVLVNYNSQNNNAEQ
jgi:hypothetical protein